MLFSTFVEARMDVLDIRFLNRSFKASLIYIPDPTIAAEASLAERTASFIEGIYDCRDTIKRKPTKDIYDFTGTKFLISLSERDEIIGSIEINYVQNNLIKSMPAIKRITRWASKDDIEALSAILSSYAQISNIAEVKRFAVKKSIENRYIGLLLAYLAVKTSMIQGHYHPRNAYYQPPVTHMIAETKPGAHVRTYQGLGLSEVFKIAHDADFDDGRGLSIVMGGVKKVDDQIITKIQSLDTSLPQIKVATSIL